MSQFSHLLRRAFSTVNLNLIYQEKNVVKIVDSFKKNTQNLNFRKKASYYEFVVQQLTRAKAAGLIEEILDDQKKYVATSNEGFAVRLISLYGKSGFFGRAHQLFDEMPELKCVRTVKSFNALLGACVSCKEFGKVGGFFRELPEKLGIKRDVVSYNTVIKGFCEMGSLDLAASMLDEMEKEGVSPDLVTFNSLFDGFYKKRRFLEGDKMWAMMEKYNVVPDIISYNMRLFGLVLQDKMQEAVELVEEIKNVELTPDKFTYNFLFKGFCSNRKYHEQAKSWYFAMVKTNCEPDIATFATLLPYACSNGDFQFAARLCRRLFHRRLRLRDVSMVQRVIDGLMKQSNVEEAKLLLQLGWDSKVSCYRKLRMRKAKN